jgi:hypothetical protein
VSAFAFSFSAVSPSWLEVASRPLPARARAVSGPPVVCFGGSRSLPPSALPLVRAVVSSVVGRGLGVSVGCAVGLDAAVIRWVLACGGSAGLRVFAVGAPSGVGFWVGSAVRSVRLAASCGGQVSWLAGGPLSVSLRARLRRRSGRSVWWAARSGRGAGFVGFLSHARSRGTLGAARFAARLGLPVVVFAVGSLVGRVPPLLFPGGSWVPAASSGVWSCGFSWVPGG